MIAGKTITLATIDGVNPEAAQAAINHCVSVFPVFDRVITLSFRKPENIQDHTSFIPIHKLTYEGYAQFSIRELASMIETEFVITIHPDGYILNPDKWMDDFLDYDYIGAPWENGIVGNSGFCLRSRLLLIASRECPVAYVGQQDDRYLCIEAKAWMENVRKLKYAPLEVAKKFSVECCSSWVDEREVFGFHQFVPKPSRRRSLP